MSTDFDFLFGSWSLHSRFLKGRLHGSTDWVESAGRLEVQPVLGGLGNVERYFGAPNGSPVEGVNLRLFNPRTGNWSIHWADNVRAGVLLPPMVGRFAGGEGEFFGDEEVDGKTVRCRFRWFKDGGDGSPRWEQAFSADEGQTWETNWVLTFTREVTR